MLEDVEAGSELASTRDACGMESDMVHQQNISLRTRGHGDMLDITDAVHRVVAESGVMTGVAHLFHVGSTAALGAIEFETGLQKDLPALLDRLIPPDSSYGHEQAWQDGNGHSHLQATLLGPALSVPVSQGGLVLGTWQQVILQECDIRARQRTVVVTVIGE
jgi:secondary thiamine-phosphate synthase enzyme